jgi:hypothetical protein
LSLPAHADRMVTNDAAAIPRLQSGIEGTTNLLELIPLAKCP